MNRIDFKWKINTMPKSNDKNLSIMAIGEVAKARTFHKSFKEYSQTPLVNLKQMSQFLGLNKLCIKDESYRFGLNAFKVLGGSYAIGQYIADELGLDISNVDYNYLTSDKLKKDLGSVITFFSATDGNHGRGVAWSSNKLGQKCIIYMPKGSTKQRLKAIQNENAIVTIEEMNYDDCVRKAMIDSAKTPHAVIIQDTAFEGYEKIPSWIMQGYGTMGIEADEQFGERPTHIFVQAGVGSLAGSMIGFFANKYKDNPPIMVVVETSVADCLYQGAVRNTGEIVKVGGDMDSIMAGLCCGEPNIISWDILRNHTTCFISAEDNVTRLGMRMLSAPLKGDSQVISGESGAVTMGVLAYIMTDEKYADLKNELKLDKNSKVLLFSTEGNTDNDRYENIVWGGRDR